MCWLKLTVGILAALTLSAQPPSDQGVHPEITGFVFQIGPSGDFYPIPDAEITFLLSGEEVGKVATDLKGAFRFPAPKLGAYVLYVDKDGYSSVGRDFSPDRVTVILDADHASPKITFILGRSGDLTGRVVDADSGEPSATLPCCYLSSYTSSARPTKASRPGL